MRPWGLRRRRRWPLGVAAATSAVSQQGGRDSQPWSQAQRAGEEDGMSRYTIPHETWTIVVGWYDALETFFVRVTLPPQDGGQGERELLWVGTEPHAVTTVARVRHYVEPYTALPEPIAAQLQRDRDGRPARRVPLPRRLPSPLWEI